MRIKTRLIRSVIEDCEHYKNKSKALREFIKYLKHVVKVNRRDGYLSIPYIVTLYFYVKKQLQLDQAETVLLQPLMQVYTAIDTPTVNSILLEHIYRYPILKTYYVLEDKGLVDSSHSEVIISALTNYVKQNQLLRLLEDVITQKYTPALILRLLALFPNDASLESLLPIYKGRDEPVHRRLLEKSLEDNFCLTTITALLSLPDFDEIPTIKGWMFDRVYSILISKGLNLEPLILCSINLPHLDLHETIEQLFFKIDKHHIQIEMGILPITQANLDLMMQYASFFADNEVCTKVYNLLVHHQCDFASVCGVMLGLDQTNNAAKQTLIYRLYNLERRIILKKNAKPLNSMQFSPKCTTEILYKYLNNYPFNTSSGTENLMKMVKDYFYDMPDPFNFYLPLRTFLAQPVHQHITRLVMLVCIFLEITKESLPYITHEQNGHFFYLPVPNTTQERINHIWANERDTLKINRLIAQIHPAELMIYNIIKTFNVDREQLRGMLQRPSIELENIQIDINLLDPDKWHILLAIFDNAIIKTFHIILVGDLENLNLEKQQLLNSILQHPKLTKLTLQNNNLNKASEHVWTWLTENISTKLIHIKVSDNHLQSFSVTQWSLLTTLINKLKLDIFDMSNHCFRNVSRKDWRTFCRFLTTLSVKELLIQDLLTPWQADNNEKVFSFCEMMAEIKCHRIVSDLSVMPYTPDLLPASLKTNFDIQDLSLSASDMLEETASYLSRNKRLYQAVRMMEQISQCKENTNVLCIRPTIYEFNILIAEASGLCRDSNIAKKLSDRVKPFISKLHFYLFETLYLQHLPTIHNLVKVADQRSAFVNALPTIINNDNQLISFDTFGTQLLDSILLAASDRQVAYTHNANALTTELRVKLIAYIALQHLRDEFPISQQGSTNATSYNLFASSPHTVLSIIDTALTTIADNDDKVLDLKLWEDLIVELKAAHNVKPLKDLAKQIRDLIKPFSPELSPSSTILK